MSASACPGVDLAMIEALLPIITQARHPGGAAKIRLAELAEYSLVFDTAWHDAKAAARLAFRLLQGTE